MLDYNQSFAFIEALTGDATNSIVDFRAIHDVDNAVKANVFRGTLQNCWPLITEWNGKGYGIFAVIAALDGNGFHLGNVQYIRAHYVDLDGITAQQNYENATRSQPAPSFAVNSSPGKYHVYWTVEPYSGNEYFQLIQRKLRQVFDGDKRVIDAARVMRLPGTLHLKRPEAPHLVTCHALPGYGVRLPVEALASALQAVNVIDGGSGQRHDLGEPSLAAPSLEWLQHGLKLVDPNDLDRGDWIALTCAVKQAGWSLTNEQTLFSIWAEWCNRYEHNDLGENLKQWNSIRTTELGWQSMLNRIPSLKAAVAFGGVDRSKELATAQAAHAAHTAPTPGAVVPATAPMPTPPALDCSGEYLTHLEQAEWFKGCIYVVNMGTMLTPSGRMLNTTQFNAAFGGKKFIIDTVGKMVNEPWQAATRSTLWTIPKVDHIRFLPAKNYGEIIIDDLGRKGVNVYKPANIKLIDGDPTPFINHLAALIPNENDRRILVEYLAHNVQFPGYKIPWAPVIQSAEGAGKGVMKLIMTYAMGRPYIYFPNAKELTNSGSQFNAWMRNKLFILADEIKVDDRRDLIEVLKPMISEEIIEIQGKGHDQELEDNFSNWLFFTNYKDAIPVNKNSRRYCIFFSPLQTADDLLRVGMNDAYFAAFYNWLKDDGAGIVTNWLKHYPIARGCLPMRAPETSTMNEAVIMSRSPIERVILESIDDGLPGFKAGWVSVSAVIARLKATGAVRGGTAAIQTVSTILEGLGYRNCGRAARPYFTEDANSRSQLFYYGQIADVSTYARAQGYE